jgi:hypothetical protein
LCLDLEIIEFLIEEKEMTKKELERDRDDWKAIAELNADKIDELRAEIARLESKIEDRDLEESTQEDYS